MDRNKMIGTIFGLGKELGMDNEDIHAVVYKEVGKESIRKCTDRQLERIVNALRFMGNMDEARRGKATFKQRQYISDLEYRLGWADTPERLRGFLKVQYGTENVKWLSVKQASNLIEALKSMLERQEIEKVSKAD